MIKYYLYIGSNNKTHQLEAERACSVISKAFDGFTAYEVIGYWKGKQERTLKVEIVAEHNIEVIISKLCKQLAKELEQDAIMMEQVESNTAFVQAD